MSHGITATDNLFSVRETPWHGLGEVLPEYPTREQAQEIAHNWEPVTEPLYRATPIITAEGPTTTYEQVDTHQAVVRSDNGHTLGVVGAGYEPVSNAEMYDIAEALQGTAPSEVRFETGGSIDGGSKVWLMLRLNEPLTLRRDPHGATIPFYTLQNSHDGSGAFRGQATNVRVVCQNTMRAADLDASKRGTEFVFRHTTSVHDRIEEAKTALAQWRESLVTWQHTMDALLDLEVTPEQTEIFLTEFQPLPSNARISDRVRNNVEKARTQFREILYSETTRDTAHTAYGWVAAATEWNQWYRSTRGRSAQGRMESRFKRAVLTGDRFNADVIDLAHEVAAHA